MLLKRQLWTKPQWEWRLSHLMQESIRTIVNQQQGGAVSDAYVHLGYEINLLCRHLNSLGTGKSKLGTVPDKLRIVLENALGQPAWLQTVDNIFLGPEV